MDVVADYDGRTGEVRALYVTPFLDENLMKEDYTGPGPMLAWYTQDGLGSVRQLVVGDTVQNGYAYTAWGVPLNWHESVSNRYTFTGREYSPETSLYHYRAREYSSATGRFKSAEIFWWRNYCCFVNNPVIFRDPSGHRGVLVLSGIPVKGESERKREEEFTPYWPMACGSFLFFGNSKVEVRVSPYEEKGYYKVEWSHPIQFFAWFESPSTPVALPWQIRWVQFFKSRTQWDGQKVEYRDWVFDDKNKDGVLGPNELYFYGPRLFKEVSPLFPKDVRAQGLLPAENVDFLPSWQAPLAVLWTTDKPGTRARRVCSKFEDLREYKTYVCRRNATQKAFVEIHWRIKIRLNEQDLKQQSGLPPVGPLGKPTLAAGVVAHIEIVSWRVRMWQDQIVMVAEAPAVS